MRTVEVEVSPSGGAYIDGVKMAANEFKRMLPEYRSLGREFRVFLY